MIAHLTACILALATMRTAPVEIYHRQFRDDAEERAAHLARSIQVAAEIYGVDAFLLLSLGWLESAFDRSRVSPVGARSIMQLNGRMGSAYDRACAVLESDEACDQLAINIAAREVRRGIEVCGSVEGSVSWFRSGTCRLESSWRVMQVIALRDEMRWGMP
jgi:hypothetical protein